jgi:hypothetical protein
MTVNKRDKGGDNHGGKMGVMLIGRKDVEDVM